jgi:hypothetical protein
MSRAREETNEHFADAGKSSPEYYVAREGITFVCKKKTATATARQRFFFSCFLFFLFFIAKQKKCAI